MNDHRKSVTTQSSERVTETKSDYFLPSMRDAEVVEFPFPRGRTGPFGAKSEGVQVRHIPNHIVTRVSQALERDGVVYKDAEDAPTLLAHYAGSLQGLQLFDKAASKQLDSLVSEFSRVAKADRKKYFAETIRPYLGSLKTASR